MNQPKRIYITGGSGVGKTTVAKNLAGRLGIPFVELDPLMWTEEGTGVRAPEHERKQNISELAAKPEWVAEGVYVGWAQEVWDAADTVILIDISLRVMLWRVFWRHVKAELRRNNRHPGWFKLWKFMKFIRTSFQSEEIGDLDNGSDEILTQAKIRAKVQQHSHKALVFNKTPDIDLILERLNNS